MKSRTFLRLSAFCLTAALGVASAAAQTTLLSENFDSLSLGDAVSPTETAATGVWTATPPADWTVDNGATPSEGPAEFFGWTFVDKDWWVTTAEDQNRSQFTMGTGNVAVADPDEYDDGDADIDTALFNSFFSTPAIDLTGVDAASILLEFDSSFRPEATQIAVLDVSYDGGANFTNLLTYVGADVPDDGTTIDEHLSFMLDNPSSGELVARWGLTEASNDWWWAIDNVEVTSVPEPGAIGLAAAAGLGLLLVRRRR